jgi:hypothetical protein
MHRGHLHVLVGHDDDAPLGSTGFLTYCLISLLLVLVAGLMSGLTIGLMAVDDLELEVGFMNVRRTVRLPLLPSTTVNTPPQSQSEPTLRSLGTDKFIDSHEITISRAPC